MDYYDALSSGNPTTPTQDPNQILQAALTAPPPNPAAVPQRQPVDTSMLGPLMLLRMAANVSQRRPYGQSTLAQALMGASDAADYGMSLKNQMQVENERKYQSDVQASRAQAENAQSAAQTEATRTGTAIAKAKAPLDFQQLGFAIQTARSESQLKAIQVRLGQVEEQYKGQLEQANLDLTNAKTDAERQNAQSRATEAQAAINQARAHQDLANAALQRASTEKEAVEDGKKRGDFKITAGLPGEQGNFTYINPQGQPMTGRMPMDQVDAIKKAQSDWKALDSAGATGGQDKTAYIKQRVQELTNPPEYAAAVQDMRQRAGLSSPGAPAAPGVGSSSPSPGSGQPSTAPLSIPGYSPQDSQRIVDYMTKNPSTPIAVTVQGKTQYYMGGKPLSPDQVASIQARGGSTVGTAPTQPSTTGAPSVVATDPASVVRNYEAAKSNLQALVSNPPDRARDPQGYTQWLSDRRALLQKVQALEAQANQVLQGEAVANFKARNGIQ